MTLNRKNFRLVQSIKTHIASLTSFTLLSHITFSPFNQQNCSTHSPYMRTFTLILTPTSEIQGLTLQDITSISEEKRFVYTKHNKVNEFFFLLTHSFDFNVQTQEAIYNFSYICLSFFFFYMKKRLTSNWICFIDVNHR